MQIVCYGPAPQIGIKSDGGEQAMKRLLLATAVLAMLVPAGMIIVNQAQAQVGPDNQPATLRTWMDQNPAPVNSTPGAFSPGLPAFAGGLPQLPDFQPKPDPNQDLF